MHLERLLPLVLLAGLTTACATSRRPLGTADNLALERVVLYRNGIGYFERHGEVADDVLRIKVRRDQINDLLKSLTVIDRKSGKAVSISMPLDPQSWANAALANLAPGQGSLAEVLDGLRGTEVILSTTVGRIRGRVVMVEELVNEPSDDVRRLGEMIRTQPERDHKITVLRGNQLEVVRLSKVRGVVLTEGDLALQLHRRLDASAGEGMFQQIEVDIRLAGRNKYDLVVTYVVAAPMWKPTYRVVLPDGGKGQALLQAWAVVDNVSGEDWTDVSMSLTSGEPIAFQYDLHTPRDVHRSDLTEAGVRRRARVAIGETTFADDDDGEEDDYAEVADELADAGDYDEEDRRESAEKSRQARAPKSKPAPSKKDMNASTRSGGAGRAAAEPPPPSGGAAEPEPELALDYEALKRSTQATARARAVSGLSRYDLGERVTVPNGSSTMVGIINESVEAEETFLYRPGGAGVGYESNPYRVVRFKNSTPFVLEPGPISIYAGGSFVGEGLSEAVGTNTSATIPFAVEPNVLVTSKVARSGDQMRLLRIVRGVLEVESYSRTETTWTAKGQKSASGFKVLVRHPKAGWNYAITQPPPGTEELSDGYLVPVVIAAGKSEASVEVVEQTPSRTSLSIWDGRAPGLLEQLMVGGDVTPQMRKTLQPIIELRLAIGRIDTEIDGLKRQQVELDQRAEETRRNLEAIKKDPAAATLRRKLNDRLAEFTHEADAIGRKVVELQSQRLETKIELEDMLVDVDLHAPAAAPAKATSKDSPTPEKE
jgi:hypothetical protein